MKPRKTVLIVEDNDINCSILYHILEEGYDTLRAYNGEEGLELLEKNNGYVDVVLLDIFMPVCNGIDFLRIVKSDDRYKSIPIIVVTESCTTEIEIECLDIGAIDFITKPYHPNVILSRIGRIIKLRESIASLNVVEIDSISGAYTMEAFYHYSKKMIEDNPDRQFNMCVAHLQDFKLFSSTFGQKKCNEILETIGSIFSRYTSRGVFGRSEDKFYYFCKKEDMFHRNDLTECREVVYSLDIPNVSLKYGCYSDVDIDLPISFMCDRATMAVETIRNSFTEYYAYYNQEMNAKRLEEQSMENDFERALKAGEFHVWFQPKIDCICNKMLSAEALVRWKINENTFIEPARFIPVFERDGLIVHLDTYVFRKVCEFQRKRFDEGKKVIPISINLSKNTIFDKSTLTKYLEIINEVGISPKYVPLELTESSSVNGYRVLELAKSFVDNGFILHMDDFGSGYSSLSLLSRLPFSEIKLDKSLIDYITSQKGYTVVKHTINIAQELGFKVVAEGVETPNQVDVLKRLRCNTIQGFVYYGPCNASIFDELLEKDAIFTIQGGWTYE